MHAIKGFFRMILASLLQTGAKAVVRKYRPRIVIVTGGVGKTLAKNAVFTALTGSFFVRRSEKSHGSDLAIPLAILGIPDPRWNLFRWAKNLVEAFLVLATKTPYPEWLVLEASADRPGDVARALAWLSPDVVVATRFPEVPSHVEFFASPGAVVTEELAPVGWLRTGGALVANADDARADAVAVPEGVRRITFGLSEGADVRASRFHINTHAGMPTGISFDVNYQAQRAHVSLTGVAGAPHAYPVLSGIAVALSIGIPLKDATAAFAGYAPLPGRMRLVPGMRDSVIVDDSYNASPAATTEALRALSAVPHAGRRIAVLADMLELGTFSVDEHRRVGVAAAASAEVLMTAGVRAHGIARGALEAGMPAENISECENTAEAASRLVALLAPGDVVLIKGSQAMRMERVVKSIMAEPEKARILLVRQDRGWLRRP